MQGHNGGPPLAFTAKVKLERIKHIVERQDLTSAQKCVGIGIVVSADREWVAEVKTSQLQTMASVKDKETVFKATKTLTEKELIEKAHSRGQSGRYNVVPPKIIEAVMEAFEELQSSRLKPDGATVENPPNPVGCNRPAVESELVRSDRPSPVSPDRFEPVAPHARARNENPSGLVTYEESGSEEKKEKGKVSAQNALDAFNAYNELAQRVGLAVARSLTPERKRAIIKRMNDNGGLPAWGALLSNIQCSSFLQGHNDRGWLPPGLDWFLKAANFTKVIEGSYGNGAHAQPKEGEFDKIGRLLHEANERLQYEEISHE